MLMMILGFYQVRNSHFYFFLEKWSTYIIPLDLLGPGGGLMDNGDDTDDADLRNDPDAQLDINVCDHLK